MSVDAIGDFLTIIRNGLMVSKKTVQAPYSVMRFTIAKLLKEHGYIKDVVVEGEGSDKTLKLFLKYVRGESVIHEIKRISKPSGRVYAGIKNVKPVIGNLGITILSTNQGLVASTEAKKLNVGGEIICTVW